MNTGGVFLIFPTNCEDITIKGKSDGIITLKHNSRDNLTAFVTRGDLNIMSTIIKSANPLTGNFFNFIFRASTYI
jgi:hypothetical protein